MCPCVSIWFAFFIYIWLCRMSLSTSWFSLLYAICATLPSCSHTPFQFVQCTFFAGLYLYLFVHLFVWLCNCMCMCMCARVCYFFSSSPFVLLMFAFCVHFVTSPFVCVFDSDTAAASLPFWWLFDTILNKTSASVPVLILNAVSIS